jgi:hypothetical protein
VRGPPHAGVTSSITRRAFVSAAGGLGLLALVPAQRLEALAAGRPEPGQRGRFLSSHELDTLRAVTARFIPGPPEDPDPGAVEGGCAEAVDLLLAAFTVDPPLIHAGGPFSDRSGSSVDDMAHFIPLDRLAELGWRIRLEGSRGLPEREFAGPVTGLQDVYRNGLAHLDSRARQLGVPHFVSLPAAAQGLLLSDQTDAELQSFVGAALSNTLEAMYGPPEYGGNRGLVGWTTTGWPGDVQPRGFTPVQVSSLDPPRRARRDLSVTDAEAALGAFLPGLRGRRAAQVAWWLGRPGYERG